jgi:hypothetical protein
LHTGFSGRICLQLVLAVVAVILVLNPLTLELFVPVSFTRIVYLLLFDALAAAVVIFALRHVRWGRRQDLVGAFGLVAALPVAMLLAERPIQSLASTAICTTLASQVVKLWPLPLRGEMSDQLAS